MQNTRSNTEFWLETCTSTMDVAKSRIDDGTLTGPCALICSREQTQGRGTSGRTWSSVSGNLHLTVAISRESILRPAPNQPAREFQLPLVTAVAMHRVICMCPLVEVTPGGGGCDSAATEGGAAVFVKWPNDILIGGEKVAGVLIESHKGYYLVGIGVNVETAPPVKDGGRKSTCLRAHARTDTGGIITAERLARSLYDHLVAAIIESPFDQDQILKDYSGLIDWTQPVVRRDRPGEILKPVGLSQWGGLIVMDPVSHVQETLSSEYLW
ncbi:biotin/lipoate protein ligase [Pelomyxa schiedti]|nr:biotin/lipoate protein ligase [Pelomyxa schiedti]